MRNSERLFEFLVERWKDLGNPEVLPLSANEISKEWTIVKNQRTVVSVPVETKTTRAYVNRLLKDLEKRGLITYERKNISNPSIKLENV